MPGQPVLSRAAAMRDLTKSLSLPEKARLAVGAPSSCVLIARSIDFENELPRLPTGKLYKRLLRDRYWGNKASRIV